MKFYLTLVSLLFLLNCSIGQNSRNEQLVKNVVIAFQNDFNEGGFKNAGNYSTKDWEHINPGGGITRGREEVLKEVRAVHQTFLKGVTLQIESITIRFLAPGIAVATVVHRISDYELPETVKHQNELQLKTYLIVKRQNKWLLTLDQNTIIAGH